MTTLMMAIDTIGIIIICRWFWSLLAGVNGEWIRPESAIIIHELSLVKTVDCLQIAILLAFIEPSTLLLSEEILQQEYPKSSLLSLFLYCPFCCLCQKHLAPNHISPPRIADTLNTYCHHLPITIFLITGHHPLVTIKRLRKIISPLPLIIMILWQ